MGSGFSKMRKQQKMMQEQMSRFQEELQKKEIIGTSEGSFVQVTLTGDNTVKAVKINPECVDPSDIEGLEDLIISAFNNAEHKLREETKEFGSFG